MDAGWLKNFAETALEPGVEIVAARSRLRIKRAGRATRTLMRCWGSSQFNWRLGDARQRIDGIVPTTDGAQKNMRFCSLAESVSEQLE